jgi:hypothetical protein
MGSPNDESGSLEAEGFSRSTETIESADMESRERGYVMCGEHGHSIDYDLLKQQMSREAERTIEEADKRFAEMCDTGVIFAVGEFPPIRAEDIGYG